MNSWLTYSTVAGRVGKNLFWHRARHDQFVEGLDGVYRSRLPIANVGLQMVNRRETRSLCHATAPACAFAHWAHPRAERRRCQGSHRSCGIFMNLLQRMHEVLVVVLLRGTLRPFNQLCGKFDRSTRCSSMQERNQVGHAWMATGTMDTKHHLLDSLQALAKWRFLQVQSSPAQGQSMLRLFTTRSFLTFPGVGHCFDHRLTELQRVVGRCLSHLPSVEA